MFIIKMDFFFTVKMKHVHSTYISYIKNRAFFLV